MLTSMALQRIAASRTTAMTDRAFALKAAGRDIISLSVGEPDFATPPHVIQAAKAALDAGETKYTAVSGTAALRESGRAVEAELRLDDLADGFLIGNALRGLIPAVLL